MMSKEKRRVPKLRFPGFTEDWEQRKLSDILKVNSGKDYKHLDQGNIPVYGTGGYMLSVNESLSNIDAIGIGRKGTIDKPQYLKAPFWTVDTLFYLTALDKHSILFLYYLMQLIPWKKFDESTGVPSLSKTTIDNINGFIPSNSQEEELISALFNQLDESITLHQRKLDNLKLKKKALLQKLFPKNGERYPELRFPEFTDAWEQCKLGEIFEYLQNNTLSRDSLNYKNPNIKNIHYGDILVKFDEILDGSNKDIPYINSDLDLSKFSKSLLKDGDIIFSDTAEDDTVGKAIELQNVNAPFILSGLHTIPCRPLIPFGKGYLGNFLNSDSYRMQLRPLVQGIKVSSISKSALKDTMIEYPKNLDEQEKIGSLFQNIAKMITLHQQEPFLCGNSVNIGGKLCSQ